MDKLAVKLSKLEQPLTPFIKWVGGKRQLIGEIDRFLPKSYKTYFEPFLGGGALFLHLTPHEAVVNDLNTELINTWQVVKDAPTKLMELLTVHQQNNSKDYYLNIRRMDRDGRITGLTPAQRAARFIYLNKTGFNGLWRVNSHGQNNVPYGRYKAPLVADERIFAVSQYLNRNSVSLLNTDFTDAVATASEGDFVYFDPPYIPSTATAAFTSYTSSGFGLEQQQKLRDTFQRLTGRGVLAMLSNSDTRLTRELYADIPEIHIHQVRANRAINSDATKRGRVNELIITNY
ncbi:MULTISPECIES: DNA adenine methylase [Lacticaseibacillus]|uniref:Site-specific DNA-methyltransferase (adenine-specific) n=2 Tax=Lacticaseibacillus TaxID=2759736 RepID=A0AAN1KFQ2_LACCA|nr:MULTISPECIES: DNA adenine methylase [Lacticaseibacillus]ARY93008.1 hypothetical protein BGL52_09930 [Lacticaseibacillus casei]KAB1971454.1 DNA adenine methylase [Lacticaseibacillus casei]WLV82287.1 DNA adenine methylase [Lacticaseibacillus sp. NCIMB 15473]WNX26204.1 DNA adenine methylase [Lacticaseibacillus casei]WNX28978.1 DNA adenine methylase [Lacticaseibacillus casei]